jgi:hypothetical protein
MNQKLHFSEADISSFQPRSVFYAAQLSSQIMGKNVLISRTALSRSFLVFFIYSWSSFIYLFPWQCRFFLILFFMLSYEAFPFQVIPKDTYEPQFLSHWKPNFLIFPLSTGVLNHHWYNSQWITCRQEYSQLPKFYVQDCLLLRRKAFDLSSMDPCRSVMAVNLWVEIHHLKCIC